MARLPFAAGALILCVIAAAPATGEAPIVVLGFDGADARLTRELMDQGELPHLSALADEGAFRPLLPTNPPQTPVSWSTFATGLDPGSTRIFDFLKRDLSDATPIPDFALMSDDQRTRVLLGERTPLVLALGAAGAIGVPVFVLLLVLRRRWWVAALAALVLGVGCGGAAGLIARNWLPISKPVPVNNRWGRTFWDMADEAGWRTRIVRVPATFPASEVSNGEFLSGLGVPDVRATIGQPAIFVSGGDVKAATGEFSVRIEPLDGPGPIWETFVLGPRNLLFYDPGQPERNEWQRARGVPEDLSLPLSLEQDGDALILRFDGREERLEVGQWSNWHEPVFAFNPLLSVRCLLRFQLMELDPHVRLYMSPVQFHPLSAKKVPFSEPPGFASHIHETGGPFRTLGWAIDTWTISDNLADEEHFLQDAKNAADRYEQLLYEELERGGFDLYVQVFNFTDRIGHILWRYEDSGHPLHDPAKAPRYREALRDAYRRMDRIVGGARKRLPEGTRFLVLSDHGFASYRRGFNINTWLVRNGYMALRRSGGGAVKTLDDLFGSGSFFENVDWSRTRAYALGLGALYVNLAGRERRGIVSPGREYEQLLDELAAGMESYVDPETGSKPVARVYRRDEMYSDFDPVLIPDLRVANNPNYRVSWQTTLGGVPRATVEDNDKAWSGDHCSLEPAEVKGILFTSVPLAQEAEDRQLQMRDVMPTLLRLMELPVPEDRAGRSFLGTAP